MVNTGPQGFKRDHSVPYVGGHSLSHTWRTHDRVFVCEDCEWWAYSQDKADRHERRKGHHVGTDNT